MNATANERDSISANVSSNPLRNLRVYEMLRVTNVIIGIKKRATLFVV